MWFITPWTALGSVQCFMFFSATKSTCYSGFCIHDIWMIVFNTFGTYVKGFQVEITTYSHPFLAVKEKAPETETAPTFGSLVCVSKFGKTLCCFAKKWDFGSSLKSQNWLWMSCLKSPSSLHRNADCTLCLQKCSLTHLPLCILPLWSRKVCSLCLSCFLTFLFHFSGLAHRFLALATSLSLETFPAARFWDWGVWAPSGKAQISTALISESSLKFTT